MERRHRLKTIEDRLFRIRLIKAEIIQLQTLRRNLTLPEERIEISLYIADKLVEIENFVLNGGFGY